MADSIRQSDELILTGNIAENWQKFKQECELYMTTSGFDAKPDKQKVALFLHVARKQAIEEFNTFALNSEEKANYDVVVGTFNSQCNPKINAQICQFENLKDSMFWASPVRECGAAVICG